MKNSPQHSVFTRLAILLCLLGLCTFTWAQDPSARDTKATPATASQTQARQATTAKATPAQAGKKVNINTASAEEIANNLNGIGLQKAQAIVAFREANGQFASKDALTAVKGIGEATVAKNSELISLK